MSTTWITALSKERARIDRLAEHAEAAIELRALLEELARQANDTSRAYSERILAMHDDEGQSFAEIAGQVGVSRARIGQIVKKATA